MLARFRQTARAFSLLALLAFIAPGMAADCREMSILTGTATACCNGPGDAGLRPECCAMSSDLPASERPASTAASARASSDSLAAAAPPPPIGEPVPAPSFGVLQTLDSDSPPDRLYIRFGVIRR